MDQFLADKTDEEANSSTAGSQYTRPNGAKGDAEREHAPVLVVMAS